MRNALIFFIAYMFVVAGVSISFAQSSAVHEGGPNKREGCYNSAGQWVPCFNDQANSGDTDAKKRAERERMEQSRRDYEEKAQRDYDERQRQRTSTSVERSGRQADAGWQCFPDYNSCTSYCRRSLGVEGNAGWCGGICSETGTGRIPKPAEFGDQRCYHAP